MIDIGSHVICVNGRFDSTAHNLYWQLPKEGEHYVIADIRLGIRTDCKTGDASVLLCGIKNPNSGKKPYHEFGFSIDRFRALEELTAEECRKYSKPEPKKELVH